MRSIRNNNYNWTEMKTKIRKYYQWIIFHALSLLLSDSLALWWRSHVVVLWTCFLQILTIYSLINSTLINFQEKKSHFWAVFIEKLYFCMCAGSWHVVSILNFINSQLRHDSAKIRNAMLIYVESHFVHKQMNHSECWISSHVSSICFDNKSSDSQIFCEKLEKLYFYFVKCRLHPKILSN
jgi:hypothetical protein